MSTFRKLVTDNNEYKYREIHTAAFKIIDSHNINFISRVSMSVHNTEKHGRSDFKRCFNVIVLHCIWFKEHAVWPYGQREQYFSWTWSCIGMETTALAIAELKSMLCIFVCVNSNSMILLAINNDNFLRTFKIL